MVFEKAQPAASLRLDGRRTQPRPAELAILEATERLLRKRPFSELAVSDILATAGVSRTSFYAHFSSRTAVLVACLRRVVGELAVAGEPFLKEADRDPEAAVRISLQRWVSLASEHGALLRTVSEEWPHDDELRELWFGVMAAFSAGTAAVIERARRSGAAPAGAEAQALATCLMWGYERVLHLALVSGAAGLDDPEQIVEPLAQMMVGGAFGRAVAT